jgi:hypothetical protein
MSGGNLIVLFLEFICPAIKHYSCLVIVISHSYYSTPIQPFVDKILQGLSELIHQSL